MKPSSLFFESQMELVTGLGLPGCVDTVCSAVVPAIEGSPCRFSRLG